MTIYLRMQISTRSQLPNTYIISDGWCLVVLWLTLNLMAAGSNSATTTSFFTLLFYLFWCFRTQTNEINELKRGLTLLPALSDVALGSMVSWLDINGA